MLIIFYDFYPIEINPPNISILISSTKLIVDLVLWTDNFQNILSVFIRKITDFSFNAILCALIAKYFVKGFLLNHVLDLKFGPKSWEFNWEQSY